MNTGRVPFKALLATAEALHVAVDKSQFPGISASMEPVDMPGLTDGKRSLMETMRSEKDVDLIADYGWEMHRGTAAFTGSQDDPVLEITGQDGPGAGRALSGRHRVRPVTEESNLTAIGVNTGESGEFLLGNRLNNSNERIWAAGDVTGHREVDYRHLPGSTSPARR